MAKGNLSKILILDCEAMGLGGQVFAFSLAKVDDFQITSIFMSGYPAERAKGDGAGREWVRDNVPESIIQGKGSSPSTRCQTYGDLLRIFWTQWQMARAEGYTLATDCPYPVETSFIKDASDFCKDQHDFEGPYPLVDIHSIVMGIDHAESVRPDSCTLHHPTEDVKWSLTRLRAAFGLGPL